MTESTSRREPFHFPEGSGCPDFNTESFEVQIAELPEFCTFEKLVRTISFIPPDPEPAPPISPPACPCPKTDSKYVSFSSSQDCCSWTMHLDYTALVGDMCTPTFQDCECKKPGMNGDKWTCGWYPVYVNGVFHKHYNCDDLKPGEARFSSSTDSQGCQHSYLVWRPVESSMMSCRSVVTGGGAVDITGTQDAPKVTGTAPLQVCVYCGGAVDDKTIIEKGKCYSIGNYGGIGGGGITQPDEAKKECFCGGCKYSFVGGSTICNAAIKIGDDADAKPVYVYEGAVYDVKLKSYPKAGIKNGLMFEYSRCTDGAPKLYTTDLWELYGQQCSCEPEDEDGEGDSGGGGGGGS